MDSLQQLGPEEQPLSIETESEAPFEGSTAVRQRCEKALGEIISSILRDAEAEIPLQTWEPRLIRWVFALGRLLYTLYMARVEEVSSGQLPGEMEKAGTHYLRGPRYSRVIGGYFGKIRFWRTSMARATIEGKGSSRLYPLDEKLGLTRDGFTMRVVSLATRLATKMPFDAATGMLKMFLQWSPAKRTIEELTLGLGEQAHTFQEQAEHPEGDGEVLVIQPDSKGIPTATDTELERRRGLRRPNPHRESKRHRGRAKRARHGRKPRRNKGDKSKNARMATMVVIYTLKRTTDENGKVKLLGPFNLRVYASFAPKRYAFQVARREAIKRGFGPKSGKTIQFVNDGDDDLDIYRKEYFGDYDPSQLVLTADLPHVMEYLWTAGTAIHPEGTGALTEWVRKQKKRLLDGNAHLVRKELASLLLRIPKQGPGNKSRRTKLKKAIRYLEANADRLDYKKVREADLELASGAVEGAVKHVIGQRFDHGGMRWIRERAEALLQLRCIEINGQWDSFIEWAHARMLNATLQDEQSARIRRKGPPPLPSPEPQDSIYSEAA